MEPVLSGSWRCESFATANEISSPISPAQSPASPTLYDSTSKPRDDLLELLYPSGNGDFLSFGESGETGLDLVSSPFLHSAAESLLIAASNAAGGSPVFRQRCPSLTQYPAGEERVMTISPSLTTEIDDEFTWPGEQSLNLEIFSCLDTAQMSPLSEDIKVEVQTERADSPSNLGTVVEEPSGGFDVEDHSSLSSLEQQRDFNANFQAILQDLNLEMPDHIEEIPTEIIDVSELRELQNVCGNIELPNSPDDISMEDDDNSNSSSDSGSIASSSGNASLQRINGQDFVVFTADDSQSQSVFFEDSVSLGGSSIMVSISQPSSVSGSDLEDDTQEMIVDTLLRRDFKAAEVLATGLQQPSGSRIRRLDATGLSQIASGRIGKSAIATACAALIKPERRGRKPSSANSDKSWTNLTDKAQRKKEQNKTAATRYRQKKKLEALMCMEQENLLIRQHDDLAKENEDLAREMKVIKQLLRELLAKKKMSQKGSNAIRR